MGRVITLAVPPRRESHYIGPNGSGKNRHPLKAGKGRVRLRVPEDEEFNC